MKKYMTLPAFLLGAITLLFLYPADAQARKLSFIRDAEIENTIRAWATPLFKAAKLDSEAVIIYLINDNDLNAFVAGGQKIFINTGLLIKSDHAGQVIGVIAHETGHIVGGHLSRTHEAMRNSSAQSIVAMVLGAAVAIGSGRPDVGGAVMLGGQSAGLRNFLAYSRTQESAADHAAIRLLDATGQSTRGMMEFMGILRGQELLSISRQDPYMRSHPLTQERLRTMENHVANSPLSNTPASPEFEAMHLRMRAKLQAFLNPPSQTLRRYGPTDMTLEARYARAIAYYRQPNLDKALPLIDGLIGEFPDDPYFLELKGQMLFENGRGGEAMPYYQQAIDLLPTSALLKRDLGRVQLEREDPALLDAAIDNFKSFLAKQSDSAFTWRQLAIAYGRKGVEGLSALALGEEALLKGNVSAALYQGGKAERLLIRGSVDWLHAQDILQAANSLKKH